MKDIAYGNQYALWRIIQPFFLEALHRTYQLGYSDIASECYFEGALFPEHIPLKEHFDQKIFHSNMYPEFSFKNQIARFRIYLTYKKRIKDFSIYLILNKNNGLQFSVEEGSFPYIFRKRDDESVVSIKNYEEVLSAIRATVGSLQCNRGGGD